MNKFKPIILILISFFAFSCSDKSPLEPEPTVYEIQGEKNGYVGTVNGTNAFIALLIAKDEGIVYVCNGEEEIYEWFRGPLKSATEISMTNDDGARISARFEGSSYEGEITLKNDSTYSFIATPNRGEDAGIYWVVGDEATQEGIELGWILNSKGEQRGAFRLRSVFQTTPAFSPDVITDGTSNTIGLAEISFSIFRFSLTGSAGGDKIIGEEEVPRAGHVNSPFFEN